MGFHNIKSGLTIKEFTDKTKINLFCKNYRVFRFKNKLGFYCKIKVHFFP